MSFRVEGAEAGWSFDDVLDLHEDEPSYRVLLECQFGIHLTLGRDMPARSPVSTSIWMTNVE